MAQIFVNSIEGVLSANLPSGSTTISGAFVSELPVVSNPDIVVLTIDPDEEEHPAEIVHVTAHSSGASTATIVRARESTVQPAQWDANRKVAAGLTKAGLDTITASVTTVQGNLNSETNARIADVQAAESAATSALSSHASGTNHPLSTSTTPGMMSAAQWGKLNAIESSATQDQTASEILTLINSVDGPGSGLNADLLDGVQGASYSQTSHAHAGVYDLAGSASAVYDAAVIKSNAVITGNDLTISGTKRVIRDYGTSMGFEYNGSAIIVGNGSNSLYVQGMAYNAGAFEARVTENGTIRNLYYYAIASARRFKDKIRYTKPEGIGWRWLLNTRQRDFVYKSDPTGEHHRYYIAEEIEDVLKEAGLDPEPYLTRDPEGNLMTLDMKSIVSDVIEGLKDLNARVEALEG